MSVAEIETKREHESFFTTTYNSLVNWARKSSLWPYPFGTACCAIEFMSVVSSHYDIARFGSEVVRFSPKQSDVLMVLGTINDKMGPVLKQIYDQMAEPRWVISMGACATCGGFYRAYHVMQGIDEIIPVVESRKMITAIRRAGGRPKYTEYGTVGHDVWIPAFTEPDLVGWLFSQHR